MRVFGFRSQARFAASYVWQVPTLTNSNAFVRRALESWQITGISTIESGQPLTLYAGVDQSHTGIGSDRAVMPPVLLLTTRKAIAGA